MDASASFLFALKTNFYPVEDNSLSLRDDVKEDLIEWMDLLYWSLPSQWELHNLINDIRQSYEKIAENPNNLKKIVESHKPGPPRWSTRCSHGKEGVGYSCGLWKLFHVLSIGVVEQHSFVLGDLQRISTAHDATTVINYVHNFFACTACGITFESALKSCSSPHCHRLWNLLTKDFSPGARWNGLALWLWQLHNEINVMLIREEADGRGGRGLTKNEEMAAYWPQVEVCPACWNSDGSFDEDEIYTFLHKEYWPKGVYNHRLIVLDQYKRRDAKTSFDESTYSITVWYLCLTPLLCMVIFKYGSVQVRWKDFRKELSLRVEKYANSKVENKPPWGTRRTARKRTATNAWSPFDR